MPRQAAVKAVAPADCGRCLGRKQQQVLLLQAAAPQTAAVMDGRCTTPLQRSRLQQQRMAHRSMECQWVLVVLLLVRLQGATL